MGKTVKISHADVRALPRDGAASRGISHPLAHCCHTCSDIFPLSVCLSLCIPLCPLQSAKHGHFSLSLLGLRIQIFWASVIWMKAPVLPGTLHRLEWKKNKNIPQSWLKAARLPQPLSCRQGAASAPLQLPAETEPAGKIIN